MAGTVFTSTVSHGLKRTLERIITDDSDGIEGGAIYKKWMDVKKMKDHYEDDLEVGGPGLLAEKSEGAEISLGSIQQGYITRYLSRTYALKLVITEEAMEDNKYKEIIQAAKRLKLSASQTIDVDTTNILKRAWNTNYPGGDGQPLFSASHTLPHGGTFSNTLSVPMSPSRAALIVMSTQARKLPGHNGITMGYRLRKIVCPVDQWAVWEEIVGSSYAPEAGEYNRINVVNRTMRLTKDDLVANHFWNNTTTNWCALTSAEGGLNIRFRRKLRTRTWVENDYESMKHAISARWSRGWSDPRCAIGSEA